MLPRICRRPACIVVVAALAAPCALLAQQTLQSATAQAWTIPSNEDVHALLAERMAHNGVGVVIGIIEPGGRRVVSYGKSGAANGRPLDGDTLFQIGSVNKTFVGLVLADMVLRGEVRLDDPASKYLPTGVTMPECGRPITLVDLATHMSGLPSLPNNFDIRGKPDAIEAYSASDLHQFLSSYQLPREPGSAPEYSNLGVSLLGRLLGRRAGMEFEELLKERVLRPLAMHSTAVHLSGEQQRRLAPGHDKDLLPVHSPEMRTLYPSGSLRSTANDLLIYLAANLGYQETPLRRAMLYQRSAARAPTSPESRAAGAPEQLLGWRTRRTAGREIIYHDGGKQGYRSGVAFDPERRTGVVVLANARTDDQPIALARHLLTGEPLRPVPAPVSVRSFVRLDRTLLDSYEGEYRAGEEVIRVARTGDHLLVQTGGDVPLELFPQSARDFGTRVDAEEVTFRVDARDKVSGLTLYPRGRGAAQSRDAARVQR